MFEELRAWDRNKLLLATNNDFYFRLRRPKEVLSLHTCSHGEEKMDGPLNMMREIVPLLSLEKEIGSIARHYGNPFPIK